MTGTGGGKAREMNGGRPRAMALLFLALGGAACHLMVGMEKGHLPEKDAADVEGDGECATSEECGDGRDCTDDSCDPTTHTCVHLTSSAGTTCRPAAGPCDEPESCDGESETCPADGFKPPSEPCREAATACDAVELCTGASPTCPEDGFLSVGHDCDDGNECTHADVCDGLGRCAGVPGLEGSLQVSAGDSHACALLQSGELRCWGKNDRGQLGAGSSSPAQSSVPLAVTGLAEEIFTVECGGQHTCAVTQTGGILCWGLNAMGQLGDGTVEDSPAPVNVPGMAPFGDFVAAGLKHTCMIHRTAGPKCWGSNEEGQLGTGSHDTRPHPDPLDVIGLPGTGTVLSLSAGSAHTCAAMPDGTAMCWGRNSDGQLGRDTTPSLRGQTPGAVTGLPPGSTVASVAAGAFHTCALLGSGAVMCWGSNFFGQLGNPIAGSSSLIPVEVEGLDGEDPAAGISAGMSHTCAILASGRLLCWGDNAAGQLGNPSAGEQSQVPVETGGLSSAVSSVSCGTYFTCAVLEAGTVFCWGDNTWGQLGDGTTTDSPLPVAAGCR